MNQPSPLDLLAAARDQFRPILAQVTIEHLDSQTPCSEWDLRALLNHIAGRAILSEAAARNEVVKAFADDSKDLVGSNPADSIRQLVDASVAAWQTAVDLDAIRVTPIGEVPGVGIMTFHAQDVFVHTWDVARTLSIAATFDPALTEAMLELHRQTVTPEIRSMFYGPEVAVANDAPAIERLVGFLGRQP
jgi:uncharacterized protein (TIGR03086 family)